VHVKVTTVRHDKRTYRYLSLVESYREAGKMRQRVIARLGEADEMAASGELARIVDALGSHLGRSRSGLDVERAPAFGSVLACRSYYCRLSLDSFFAAIGTKRRQRALCDAVFVMLANRLVAPSSKRRAITDWLGEDVALPDGVSAPSLDQCYRALDVLCAVKEELESHLYNRLTDLTNLDLRLVCYDLTSSYLEGDEQPSERFSSKAFGYSRDHRPDRPQIVIGLLVTGDGIPIAHHVFSGNTSDVSTLPQVLDDLQARFGVGRIAVVCDRGLVSEANLDAVAEHGFDHVLATRLHRDPDVEEVLEACGRASWVRVDDEREAAEVEHDGRRYVVVYSARRKARDRRRLAELLERTEARLIALQSRVEGGRLVDPAKIGAAAERVLADSGVKRCFVIRIGPRNFTWDYDQDALAYEEELLAGRFVITTSLSESQASTVAVVRHYLSLQAVERRFRVLKDFLALRPIYHFTEERVRGHVALCVLAGVVEALIGKDLEHAKLADPDLAEQTLSPRRALRELSRIRAIELSADDGARRTVVTKPSRFQSEILDALAVDARSWTSRIS
jgi:transposase